MAWAGLNGFIDDQLRPTYQGRRGGWVDTVVPVLQVKRREGIEGIAVFLTAAMNSVRIFFSSWSFSVLNEDVKLTVQSLLTKKPMKSPFCLRKAYSYSFHSAKIEISGSQQSQTRKLKHHKSTRNFIEDIENKHVGLSFKLPIFRHCVFWTCFR